MRKLHWIALAVTTAVLVAGSSIGMRAEARSKCVRAGGQATMITEDLAKFMANAALKNAIAAKNLKPSGKVTLTCRDDAVTTYCKASRPACT